MDVTSDDSIDAALAAVLDRIGRVDTVVNNAGISKFRASSPVCRRSAALLRDTVAELC